MTAIIEVQVSFEPPREIPEYGIYHPVWEKHFASFEEYSSYALKGKEGPTVDDCNYHYPRPKGCGTPGRPRMFWNTVITAVISAGQGFSWQAGSLS